MKNDPLITYPQLKAALIEACGQDAFETYREIAVSAVRNAERAARLAAGGEKVQLASLSGWFEKKGKRRWFEIHPPQVRYYVGEQNGTGEVQKGFILIGANTVITTAYKKLIIANDDRVWTLIAEGNDAMSSEDQASLWESALSDLRPRLASAIGHQLTSLVRGSKPGSDGSDGIAPPQSYTELKARIVDAYGEAAFDEHKDLIVDAVVSGQGTGALITIASSLPFVLIEKLSSRACALCYGLCFFFHGAQIVSCPTGWRKLGFSHCAVRRRCNRRGPYVGNQHFAERLVCQKSWRCGKRSPQILHSRRKANKILRGGGQRRRRRLRCRATFHHGSWL